MGTLSVLNAEAMGSGPQGRWMLVTMTCGAGCGGATPASWGGTGVVAKRRVIPLGCRATGPEEDLSPAIGDTSWQCSLYTSHSIDVVITCPSC